MSETGILQLPLVQAAQAQKHITVNEGLRRLDGMVQLRLQSLSISTPPLTAQEGECWFVPSGAVNDWAGHEGEIATFANGGWVFTMVSLTRMKARRTATKMVWQIFETRMLTAMG